MFNFFKTNKNKFKTIDSFLEQEGFELHSREENNKTWVRNLVVVHLVRSESITTLFCWNGDIQLFSLNFIPDSFVFEILMTASLKKIN